MFLHSRGSRHKAYFGFIASFSSLDLKIGLMNIAAVTARLSHKRTFGRKEPVNAAGSREEHAGTGRQGATTASWSVRLGVGRDMVALSDHVQCWASRRHASV